MCYAQGVWIAVRLVFALVAFVLRIWPWRRAPKPLDTSRKALLIRGAVWAFFGYALGAYSDYMAMQEDVHVWRNPIVKRGLVLAVVLFVGLVAAVYVMMRKAPHWRRVVIEAAIVLFISLPAAGIQLVADTNRAVANETVQMKRLFERCDEELGGRRGTRYGLMLGDPNGLPKMIRVDSALCHAGKPGDPVAITVAKGLWGLPYYREITIRDARWQP